MAPRTKQSTAVAEIRKWNKLVEAAKPSANAANRQKTQAKNALVDFLKQDDVSDATVLCVDGVEYTFSKSCKDVLSAEAWYKAFQKGEITEKQFLAGISVSMEFAKGALGDDVVQLRAKPVYGDTADIRTKKIKKGDRYEKGVHIYDPDAVKTTTSAPKLKTKRRVRVRAS